ncbi:MULTISPECIES: ATP phosphoribosyltransferase regulatory subunit [Aliarcobacter]|jgi:histidyl-tRNA synthetase|uniref:ATP phosphoribosyltransferase regulatory subunit n=6 Tax=Arcobacteraceae TaxID=2808963 RepID=A0AAU0P3Q9_9BACT|nr:ATP phosphoribosyltransferase regulatory subunit [Aliarcobacter cryaerophilus]NCB10816.1 ATP phosphoribosyltransferase regulatory subunit [Erysipelotrichia bacterium]WNL16687.1 ATP phosphoribosyltransferase regulatory subunit [Arcobacter sp. AZ-2023]WPD03799.1 ATP phosphoribosyltransferase regulatory subunit [Arcobacter sp. DSM 115972]WPD05826.1 ATP phosphoribosyltransferase regulatory subunit [Arcobacter sp. DSM 115956]WPD07918.1 ATP phosphoribosyltransferase regulatory subunit [Arcobacter
MIFEHEIPKGSRLYFGKTAKAKRVLENSVCEILEKNGFEEILTPNFSYSQHQSIEDNKKLIKFSDEENEQVSLRADSTLDVVRIITKRLGRATNHRKWFYIQPIFSYPSKEDYQIGCEWIEHNNISDIMNLTADILRAIKIEPILQISNINIPKLISTELNISIDILKNGDISELLKLDCDWLNNLLRVKDIKSLENIIEKVPNILKKELEILLEKSKEVKYSNIIIAPMYYGSLKYYNGVYYRVIDKNLVLCRGGMYETDGISSLGFALYTDNLLKMLEG